MRIGDALTEFKEHPDSNNYEVLTLTEKQGFVRQADRFNKRLALSDTSKYKVIRKNDIAFNPYLLWAGAIALNDNFDSGIISPLYPTFHVKESFDPTYLKYILLSPQAVQTYDNISFGSVQRKRRATTERFLEIPLFNLPPLEKQRRIADILRTSDTQIQSNKAKLRKLSEFQKGLFAATILSHAEKKAPLGQVCKKKGDYGIGASATEFDEERGRYIRITDITDEGDLNDAAVSPGGDVESYSQNKRLNPGDLLFARTGATVGKTYLHTDPNTQPWYAGYLVRFKVNSDIVDPLIVFDYCHTDAYWRWVENRQQVAAQPNINAQIFGSELLIPLAPRDNQDEYLSIRVAITEMKNLLIKKLALLEELHHSLATRAFAGQL